MCKSSLFGFLLSLRFIPQIYTALGLLWTVISGSMIALGDNSCHGNSVLVIGQTCTKACTGWLTRQHFALRLNTWEICLLLIVVNSFPLPLTIRMVCYLFMITFSYFNTVCTVTFLFYKFQTKLKMPRSSLLWVGMHIFQFFALILSQSLTYSHKWFFPLYFRWAWFWKGHSVWENSCKIRLHPSVIRRSAPCWSGLWLWEGQAAPGHHAEGRACPPGKTLWTEKHFRWTPPIHRQHV